MNARRNSPGFTLVEIMIVVVIVGLLSTLAIPAFRKMRNNAIEKAMINDARQIASSAQQYMSENAFTYATVSQIGKSIVGGRLSTGVACSASTPTAGNWSTTAVAANGSWLTGSAVVVKNNEYFQLGHASYDSALSSNAAISAQVPASATCIIFTDLGSIK